MQHWKKKLFFWLLTVFSDLWSDKKRYQKTFNVNMSTELNKNFKPALSNVQISVLVQISTCNYLDDASFTYLNIIFQKTRNTKQLSYLTGQNLVIIPLGQDRCIGKSLSKNENSDQKFIIVIPKHHTCTTLLSS